MRRRTGEAARPWHLVCVRYGRAHSALHLRELPQAKVPRTTENTEARSAKPTRRTSERRCRRELAEAPGDRHGDRHRESGVLHRRQRSGTYVSLARPAVRYVRRPDPSGPLTGAGVARPRLEAQASMLPSQDGAALREEYAGALLREAHNERGHEVTAPVEFRNSAGVVHVSGTLSVDILPCPRPPRSANFACPHAHPRALPSLLLPFSFPSPCLLFPSARRRPWTRTRFRSLTEPITSRALPGASPPQQS